MSKQADNLPLPVAEVVEILRRRAALTRRGRLTPWDRVALAVPHSKATCIRCERWFNSQPFEQVENVFPEEVLRLHPDYLKRRAADIGQQWALHYEEVRVAASEWAALPEPSPEALAGIWDDRFTGWGLTWFTEGPVRLANDRSQPTLRGHLVPAAAPESFWGDVDRLVVLGDAYLELAGETRRLVYKMIADRHLRLIGNMAHVERGVTHGFARTLWAIAMAQDSEGEYQLWGLEWHGTGRVVTSATEAESLSSGRGWMPGIRTVHHVGGGFPHAPDENTRHVYGNPELPPSGGYVLFGLSYRNSLIASGLPEEIEEARRCHWELVSACQRYSRAARRKKAELDSLWERIAGHLRAASRWQRFPGSCPLCPGTPPPIV